VRINKQNQESFFTTSQQWWTTTERIMACWHLLQQANIAQT